MNERGSTKLQTMRVLYLTTRLNLSQGDGTYSRNVIEPLEARGIDSRVLLPHGEAIPEGWENRTQVGARSIANNKRKRWRIVRDWVRLRSYAADADAVLSTTIESTS